MSKTPYSARKNDFRPARARCAGEGRPRGSRSAAAAAILAAWLGSIAPVSQAAAETPGHPTCHALEKTCLARVERLRILISRASDASEIHVDAVDTQDVKCYDANASARRTGIWPADKGIPAMACRLD